MTREEIANYRHALNRAVFVFEVTAREVEAGTAALNATLKPIQAVKTVAEACEREITKETK